MLVKSYAAAVQGISATVVTVEVNCSKGIQFFLVGLPDVAVRESHERIISALQVCGYKFTLYLILVSISTFVTTIFYSSPSIDSSICSSFGVSFRSLSFTSSSPSIK